MNLKSIFGKSGNERFWEKFLKGKEPYKKAESKRRWPKSERVPLTKN